MGTNVIRGVHDDYIVDVFLPNLDAVEDYIQQNEYGTVCIDMYSAMCENRVLLERQGPTFDKYAFSQEEVESIYAAIAETDLQPVVGETEDGTLVVSLR